MEHTTPPKPSTLPAKAVLLVILMIVTSVSSFFVGAFGIPFKMLVGATLAWCAMVLFDAVSWLMSDKATRPGLKFPAKSLGALFVTVVAVFILGLWLGLGDL